MGDPILGVDLSLRATGLVVVPERWGFAWSRIVVRTVGQSLGLQSTERERYARVDMIADCAVRLAASYGCKIAAIEQYAFSRGDAHAHELGELGGVVRDRLYRLGLEIHTYGASQARRLLGKAPRKAPKAWAHQCLQAAGAPKAWGPDVCDAFLQANFHLSGAGGDALILEAA